MRQSLLFTKTRKEAPADEVSKNAELLIRTGFVHKEMAGVYSYLPLGLRVLKKIENIIREEMNSIGGQEITLTALQEKELWQKTNGGKKFVSIHREPWPEYDPAMIQDSTFELVVQVNGRIRGKITLPVGTREREARSAALGLDGIKMHLSADPRKTIFVPNRLINFVI